MAEALQNMGASARVAAPRRVAGRFEPAFLAAFWLAFTALAFLFPYNGDDWAWGSPAGIDRLNNWFRNYNGRYAGDVIVIALTRTPWLTPLVVSAAVTLTVFLVLELTGQRTALGYTVAVALFLAMPLTQWRESVAWVSGFSNYVLGTMCMLVFLRATTLDWSGRLGRRRIAVRRCAIVVLAVVSALFVENLTLYLLVAGLAALVALRIRRGRLSWDAVCWFAGFVGGAALMFSNGSYRQAQDAQLGFHRVSHASAQAKLLKLSDVISREAISGNLLVNVMIVLLVGLVAAGAARRIGKAAAGALIAVGTVVLGVSWTLVLAENTTAAGALWRYAPGVIALLLIGLLCATASTFADRDRRLAVFGCCASIVVLTVPLVFVDPIGPRCFYCSYVVFLVIVGLLFGELGGHRMPRVARVVAPCAGAVGVALLVGYFIVYSIVAGAAARRIAHIRAEVAAGARTVDVRPLPFGDYVHMPDPTPGSWAEHYKAFYKLPRGLDIVLRPAPLPSMK